jgi:hypothetical protein
MQRLDFKISNSNIENYYDIVEDWPLIEASFAKQYNIRIRQQCNDMSWSEFATLLYGLMPDTPLGQIIQIRSETNPDIIKTFNKEQLRIRNEWFKRQANKLQQNEEELNKRMNTLTNMLKSMFSKNK